MWFGALGAMYREPFSAGVTRVPGGFLLALPGRVREETRKRVRA
jgi:hypothetical protein